MDVTTILTALETIEPVIGLTHDFYRYPARFSPKIVRALIERFTVAGETVLDPFMGSGTTLVEALALGRNGVGTDISSFATFLARVKTTILSEESLTRIVRWVDRVAPKLSPVGAVKRHTRWERMGYQRWLPWRVRKMVEQALNLSDSLRGDERAFIRCALLRTAQWATDCKREVPNADLIREQFQENVTAMSKGMGDLREAKEGSKRKGTRLYGPYLASIAADELGTVRCTRLADHRVKLLITSPPYPGVHILYHRWQIESRRETPAPFWIAGCLDGHGASHYTFGDRRHRDRTLYFKKLTTSFGAIRKVLHPECVVAQLVGFNQPDEQLPLYLAAMDDAGFDEYMLCETKGHLWRAVPNRKWYTHLQDSTNASSEVLLLHRPRRRKD